MPLAEASTCDSPQKKIWKRGIVHLDNASGSIAAVMRHCPESTLKSNFAQANSWRKIGEKRHCPHGQWTEGQH